MALMASKTMEKSILSALLTLVKQRIEALFSWTMDSLYYIFLKMASRKKFQNNNEYDEIVNLQEVNCGDKFWVPEDLIVEILLNLPVKSLIRFKAVCKPWNLLINSLVFTHKHLHRKNPQHGLFPVQEEDNSLSCKIDDLVGSCNGIICFKTTNNQTPLALYNPTTKEFSFLPEECSGDCYGFCYVSQTQEYKVISCIGLRSNCKEVVMKIMTLGMKTKSFRDVKGIISPGRIKDVVASQANCGSNIVWLVNSDDCYYFNDANAIVICYDAYEDKVSKMDAPSFNFDIHGVIRTLAVIEDSVIMFVHSDFVFAFFDMWILIDIGSEDRSWMKYRAVEPWASWEPIRPLHACRRDIRWVICSKIEDHVACQKSSDLFYYNVETGQVEDYKATTDPEIEVLKFVNYVESLVSPVSMCSMD